MGAASCTTMARKRTSQGARGLLQDIFTCQQQRQRIDGVCGIQSSHEVSLPVGIIFSCLSEV
eukprot:4967218-Amphidinium_carterae.1